MFILRRVVDEQGSDQQEINVEIGPYYTFVTKGRNKKAFDEAFDRSGFSKEQYNEIYGFVSSGGKEESLSCAHNNYIMTETGKTFAHL